MANLSSNEDDSRLTEPIDPTRPKTLDANSTPKTRAAVNNQHFKEIAGHLIDNSVQVGHGHGVGSQGPKGHVMVSNDAHFQKGAYIPQSVFSDGAGSAEANDASTRDYGVVDNKND